MEKSSVLRIIIADDEAVIRMGLSQMIDILGHRVVATATNGDEALEATKRLTPDLLLLDIKMPGIDGFDFLERLKGLNLKKKVKVYMLTSSLRAEDKLKAFSFRAVIDYFEKPLTVDMVQMVKATYLN